MKMNFNDRIFFADGGMGTLLQREGVTGTPELLNIENPGLIKKIHRQYIEAGCDFITANTFGANRIKLEADVENIVASAVAIAREVADMIIMDDNFKSIVAGVKEGRVAFANIRKIIYFLLSCGLAEVLFFCLSILFNMPMPLVAIQLLWLNIVTDGIQDFALSFEKAEKNVMKEKQKNSSASIIDKSLLTQTLTSGFIIGILVFIVWYYLVNIIKMDVSLARGYIMLLMVFMQNIHVFNCRSEKQSAFQVSIKSNPFIVISVISCILLQVIVMETPVLAKFLQTSPVPLMHVLMLFLVATIVLIAIELYKEFVYHKKND